MRLIGEARAGDYVHGGTQRDEYSEDDVVKVRCPFCESEAGRRIYTEHGVIGITRCTACGLIYTSPRLKDPERVYWGDSDIYYAEARLIFEGRATHHRDPNYLAEIRRIERHKRSGRFLDVGCNMGMLLRLARQRGWDVTGVEPSASLARLAAKWGFPVFNCFLHEVPADQAGSFDVVALSDVFEHIPQPVRFLSDARRLLKDDGIMYVKVPNARWSLLKQALLSLSGRRPKRGLWDSYEHVVHYTDETLTRMLSKSALSVREIGGEPPIQTPNWHERVGQYYAYPTPWFMDWRRKFVRGACYHLASVERMARLGGVGFLAPNVVAVAEKAAWRQG
ncbi:MAG TPA: class I SAM-dependent methyltransferase [Solirubrobacteraceae bacterium]|nr:class I SAM-dependent methyltransferase [Solirubrobacteraceae bacterium]